MAAQPDQPLIDKARLWSAPLLIAWVVNFCLGFVFYLLMTSLALYAVHRFGVSDAAGGFAASVFVLGATAARLFAGSLVDAVGGHRIMTGSLAVMLLVSLGYLVVDDYALLLVVRGAHGVAFGVASTATMTIAQSVIPVQRHAEGTGYFTLSTTVATALGPLVALLLVDSVGYQGLFGAGTLAATMATVLGLCLRAPDHRHGTVERGPVRRFRFTGLLHPRVVPVASFMSVMAICYSGVLTYLHPHAGRSGLEGGASGFFLAYAVVLVGARLVAGRIQDRHGPAAVVAVASVAFAAGLALLAVGRSDVAVVFAGGLVGLGFGTLMSAMQAVAVGRVSRQRIGVALSTHYFMVDLGIGLGPVLLGLVVTATGFRTMYAVLAGVVVVSLGTYLLVSRRARPIYHADEGRHRDQCDDDDGDSGDHPGAGAGTVARNRISR